MEGASTRNENDGSEVFRVVATTTVVSAWDYLFHVTTVIMIE